MEGKMVGGFARELAEACEANSLTGDVLSLCKPSARRAQNKARASNQLRLSVMATLLPAISTSTSSP